MFSRKDQSENLSDSVHPEVDTPPETGDQGETKGPGEAVPGNAQVADGQTDAPAVYIDDGVSAAEGLTEAERRTLRDACKEFLKAVDYVLYTRKKRLGDLMAVRQDVQNFMGIKHPILKEPVE